MTSMQNYSCLKCQKAFDRFSNYKRHINRIIDCKKKDTCSYCNRHFDRSFCLKRHELICKKKDTVININPITNNTTNNITNPTTNNITNNNPVNTTNNITNPITNNNTNCNNTTNVTNNNVILVGYGKEKNEGFPDEDMINICKKGYESILEFFRYIHFNDKYPQYQNIYKVSSHDSDLRLYTGARWELTRKGDKIDSAISKYIGILSDIIDYNEEFKKKLGEPHIRNMTRFLDKIQDEKINKLELNIIRKEIELMLYNDREMPKRFDICNKKST